MKTLLHLFIIGIVGISISKAAAMEDVNALEQVDLVYNMALNDKPIARTCLYKPSKQFVQEAASKRNLGGLIEFFTPVTPTAKITRIELLKTRNNGIFVNAKTFKANFWEAVEEKHPDIAECKDLRTLPLSSIGLLKHAVLKVIYSTR